MFTITDADAPTVDCEAVGEVTVTTSSDGTGDCAATFPDVTAAVLAQSTDNCAGTPTASQSPMAGEPFSGSHNSTMTVTVSVNDDCTNTTQCDVTVRLIDDEDPSITCPDDEKQ